ncbi:MAG: acyl-CoA dehydrogenase family protein [Myxococcales bacterium]|nr:acyl-CoA dehydrogenase family protein [Myxococcales bacterium]MDD9968881.1 acyl-CoA dehydrogenase family protein [Myxococcales bacterium]
MINLELTPNLEETRKATRGLAEALFRPISRKYDRQEHAYPEELKALGGPRRKRTAEEIREAEELKKLAKAQEKQNEGKIVNGSNLNGVVSVAEMCWGDVGLMLSIPGAGLGNAAISAVATPEQKERFGHLYASMAITEPSAGSDSAGIQATAFLDGDEWVINGEKIFITAGERSDAVVVWATVDKSAGKAAIKSFVVPKDAPGLEFVGLENKLGLRASDTATIRFDNCRVPKDNLLGDPEIKRGGGSFGGVMQTFDNTRPTVAAMAIGVARASLDLTIELLEKEGIKADYAKDVWQASAIQAELYRMETDWEAARLLTMKAAWMSDNKQANSMEASMCKAKAGRVGNYITLRCVELCGAMGYSETELLEKWARDSKILDIFEGTQQIQLLIVARRLLNKSSAELK